MATHSSILREGNGKSLQHSCLENPMNSMKMIKGRRREKDEMVGWHLQLNGHEFEQALGDGEEQESLVCCTPWGRKELDMTEQLNNGSNMSVWCFTVGKSCLHLTTQSLKVDLLIGMSKMYKNCKCYM